MMRRLPRNGEDDQSSSRNTMLPGSADSIMARDFRLTPAVSRISRVIGSRPSLTIWLKNKGSRAVFFHGAAFHGFLSVYGTHFHKVTNFPAIVFVWKSSCKSSRNPG